MLGEFMVAKKSIYLAVFGLSLRDLNDLKEQIRKIIPSSVNICWSNVAEPKLQALLINETFFDTPSIQNIIKTHNLSVLRIISRSEKNSIIEADKLYLPIINTSPLENWFANNILFDEEVRFLETESYKSPVQVKPQVNSAEFFKELLNPSNGLIQLFDRHGRLGIADTRKQIFFEDEKRTLKFTDGSLNFTYATMSDAKSTEGKRQFDLLFWLWTILWKSPDYLELAPEDGYFKLKFWPQPEDGFDRRDILRLSACFAEGANISLVSEHVDISHDRVRQYMIATILVGFGNMSNKADAKFTIPEVSKVLGGEEVGMVRKFFGGLRRRLGL